MRKAIDWIERHQVVAFFILTFAITWGLGFAYSGVLNRGLHWLFPVVSVATCGPALAGLIITVLTNRQPRQGPRRAFWIAFPVAWIVSALVWVVVITLSNLAEFSVTVLALAFVSAIPVAFVIGIAYSRLPAVKSYLSSLVRLRGVWGWAALALVLFPGLILLAIPISSLLGRQPISSTRFSASGLDLIILVVLTFLYQFFFFNATGEEVGWRGFALPRLQARTSPLIAALIIDVFWGPWHFFLWRAEGLPVLTLQFWVEKYIIIVLASLLIVWIYNRARGSILVAGITHAAMNTGDAVIPVQDGVLVYGLLVVAVLVVVLVDRMWKKLPPDHPAVYQAPISGAETLRRRRTTVQAPG